MNALSPLLKDWRARRVWLVGASTGIGRATASALHAKGATVFVSARSAQDLASFEAGHVGSTGLALDVTDHESVKLVAAQILAGGPLDLVMFCAGYYRELGALDFNLPEMLRHQQVNYVGALNVLDAVLPALLRQGHGHVSLTGSVAGYRGLPRSLGYGPTKAALINLAETLYMDLQPQGLGVSLINPGFVETPLTASNRFHMPALITPAVAADRIVRGWAKGHFEIHFPRRFTLAMKGLALLPFGAYQAVVRRITRQ